MRSRTLVWSERSTLVHFHGQSVCIIKGISVRLKVSYLVWSTPEIQWAFTSAKAKKTKFDPGQCEQSDFCYTSIKSVRLFAASLCSVTEYIWCTSMLWQIKTQKSAFSFIVHSCISLVAFTESVTRPEDPIIRRTVSKLIDQAEESQKYLSCLKVWEGEKRPWH